MTGVFIPEITIRIHKKLPKTFNFGFGTTTLRKILLHALIILLSYLSHTNSISLHSLKGASRCTYSYIRVA